jgi:hypothetical protein
MYITVWVLLTRLIFWYLFANIYQNQFIKIFLVADDNNPRASIEKMTPKHINNSLDCKAIYPVVQ